jgi:hypothetical protein
MGGGLLADLRVGGLAFIVTATVAAGIEVGRSFQLKFFPHQEKII